MSRDIGAFEGASADATETHYSEVTFGPPLVCQSIEIPAPDGALPASDGLPVADAGGACMLQLRGDASSTEGQHGLSWTIGAADPHSLTLHEWSLCGAMASEALRITFTAPLLPAAAISVDNSTVALYALTADAALHCVFLQQRGPQGGRSLLQQLAEAGPTSVASIVLPNAAELRTPVALAAVAGAVCIGGTSGGVRCIPQQVGAHDSWPRQHSADFESDAR